MLPFAILLAIILTVAIIAGRWVHKKSLAPGLETASFGAVVGLMVGCVIAFLVFKLPFTRMVNWNEILVKDGAIICEGPNLLWRWDDRLEHARFADTQILSVYAETSVQPITANPKVRPLKIALIVSARGSKEATLMLVMALPNTEEETLGRSVNHLLRYHLYNFMEEQSRELAEFYNPEDGAQQQKFRKMVETYFDPHLAKAGLRFKDAQFIL